MFVYNRSLIKIKFTLDQKKFFMSNYFLLLKNTYIKNKLKRLSIIKIINL